jgi:hypothetical protein
MARSERHDADYFPFYCKEGNATKYIETTYGNDGFAVWIKTLRELTKAEYHYLNLSSRPRLMVFCSTCKVGEDLLLTIINDLVELGEFDADLWKNDRIIWSDKFIDSIQDAYKNRKNKIVKRAEFIQRYEDLTGKKLITRGITSVRNPQSKEEKSKVEERKEITAPVLVDEIVDTPKAGQDFIEAICKFFSIKPIVTSKIYNSICDFVATTYHRNELTIAALALQNYSRYKARSQEAKHSIEKWIGTKDNFYQDGHWITTDWEAKNKNYAGNGKHQEGTTASSAVIESGKGFGDLRSHRANTGGSSSGA